jgi:hypothetical protein
MELQEIRIASFFGLAALWIVVLLIGGALAALGRALEQGDVVAATKEPRC